MRARTSLVTCVAALATTAAVVAGANAASSAFTEPAVSDPTATFTVPAVAVPAVQLGITNNFALFRDAPSPVPRQLVPQIASPTRFGRNAALARAITTPYGKGWVIPGDGWLCIAMPDPVDGYGESCNPTSVAIQRGLWLRLAGDTPDAKAADVLLVPEGATVKQSASDSLAAAGTGVVSRLGVAADPPPTLSAG